MSGPLLCELIEYFGVFIPQRDVVGQNELTLENPSAIGNREKINGVSYLLYSLERLHFILGATDISHLGKLYRAPDLVQNKSEGLNDSPM